MLKPLQKTMKNSINLFKIFICPSTKDYLLILIKKNTIHLKHNVRDYAENRGKSVCTNL